MPRKPKQAAQQGVDIKLVNKRPSYTEVRSLRKARSVVKRALNYALASNLRNVHMTSFTAITDDPTRGMLTIVMTYPYKPSPKR